MRVVQSDLQKYKLVFNKACCSSLILHSTAALLLLTTMAAVIDALAQWDALAQREVAAGYQVKPSSTKYMSKTGQNTTTGCPSAWREKIAEWCFEVVDHW
jgi:hypothetical protein